MVEAKKETKTSVKSEAVKDMAAGTEVKGEAAHSAPAVKEKAKAAPAKKEGAKAAPAKTAARTAAAKAEAPAVKEEAPKAEAPAAKEKASKAEAPAVKEKAPRRASVKKAPVKPEAKKPAPKKAEPETAVHFQFDGKDLIAKDVLDQAVKAFKSLRKGVEIKSIELYVVADESAAYYVVNGEGSDDFKVML